MRKRKISPNALCAECREQATTVEEWVDPKTGLLRRIAYLCEQCRKKVMGKPGHELDDGREHSSH